MKTSKIKDIIKDNKVNFSFCRAGFLYYNINFENQVFQFPVPLYDIGDATLQAEDKAILFMRYIRMAILADEFCKIMKVK